MGSSDFFEKNKHMKNSAKFGTLLGVGPGNVNVYSSEYASASLEDYPTRYSYRSYIDDVFLGYKWQCVELARRWLFITEQLPSKAGRFVRSVFFDIIHNSLVGHISRCRAKIPSCPEPLPPIAFA